MKYLREIPEVLNRLIRLGDFGLLKRRRKERLSGCDYSSLEGRALLAAIVFENGVLSLNGTGDVDRATLDFVGSESTVRVETSGALGFSVEVFPRSQISEVVFIGLGGDDFFRNRTDVPSRAFGHNGDDVLLGGSGDDTLIGGAGGDELRGNEGDDVIRGSNGGASPDVIFGDEGNDRLFGGTGDNTISAGAGDDVVFGGNGNDEISGGSGDDQLFSGAGVNIVRGGTGDDLIIGGADVDTVFGDAGADRIFALGGDDVIDGGTEDDTLFGGQGNDTHIGGSGDDTIRTGPGDDRADAGVGDDFISGFEGSNTLAGGSGDDLIVAGSGDDVVDGGAGNDWLFGQSGDDSIEGGTGVDFIAGGNGDDTIRGGDGNDQLLGEAGDDFLEGGSGNDSILGQDGNDQLFGSNGSDTLEGGAGIDGLSGGAGVDQLTGGPGSDRYLNLSGDENIGVNDADVTLSFRNGTSRWTHREIEVIDEGLRQLHIRTGGTRVFRGVLDPGPLTFFKESRAGNAEEIGANRLENRFSFNAEGEILSEVFTRRIELAEFNENDERESGDAIATIIHEIAHNWDSAREISEAFSGQGSIWTTFLSASGWRTSAASGFIRSELTTSEPFDLEFNAGTQSFTQVTDTWYYRAGTEFARDYGSASSKEDWSTVWEAALSEDPADRVGITAKVNAVNRLFDLL